MADQDMDDAARLEHALDRIARAAARPPRAFARAPLAQEPDIAARLDSVIAELRGALASDSV